jgi:predicted Zn-dependent protease
VAALVAHRLVTVAYNRSRSTDISASLAAKQAEVFLEAAQKLEPGNIHTLKLLVEAAAATGNAAVEREALRSLVRQDPGDLVAQVQYIDFLAAAAETIDERAKTFESALRSTALHPQIRSEMAVRLANISLERGDTAAAKGYVQQALQFNDVNMGALRANVRLAAATPKDHVAALIALLNASPLQPEAWLELSRTMAAAGLPGRAADDLNTALEQYQLAGQQPPATLYLELAVDLATAGRPAEASPILTALAKLPDAPLSALVAARLLANEYTPPSSAAHPATTAPATQAAADELSTKIQSALAASIAADPDSVDALTDALWVELTAIPKPTPPPETASWMKTLQGKVDADDPVLARLQGWQALRDGRLEEASKILTAAAPADPLAQLGLARVLIAQGKIAQAARQLQDLWWSHPTGLFALQIAQTARGTRGITLTDTLSTKELLTVLAQLPSTALLAHRSPVDLQLVTASFPQREYGLDEPIVLNIRIANTTAHAAPVGPDGLIKTTIGLAGKSYGIDGKNLGVYAIEDLQRVYRLEPRSVIEASVRADQGAVDEFLSANPRQIFTVGIDVITAPRGAMASAVPGLGGQDVPVGDFQRTGHPIGSVDDIQKLVADVGTATGRAQAVDAELLCFATDMLSDETARRGARVDEAADEAKARTDLRASVNKALAPLLQSPSAAMRAWMVMNLPVHGLDDLVDTLEGMSSDPDPVVRVIWAQNMLVFAEQTGQMAEDGRKALEKALAGGEKDPLVRRTIEAMLAELKERAAKPAKAK